MQIKMQRGSEWFSGISQKDDVQEAVLPPHDPESMKRLNSSKKVLPPMATVALNCDLKKD